MPTEFRETVRLFLKRKKWTQDDLAKATGIAKEHLSRILTNKMLPSADVCHKIGTALELGPADYQYLHRLAARLHGFAV